MKFSRIPPGLALAAALAMSASGAFAATGLHSLSETELATVYAHGLTEPVLSALTTTEQGSSAVSAAAVNDVLASLAALSADGARNIDRQMAQQRLQGTTTGIQGNLKIAQGVAALNGALAPIAGGLSSPVTPFPPLFALPALPSLDAIQKKH